MFNNFNGYNVYVTEKIGQTRPHFCLARVQANFCQTFCIWQSQIAMGHSRNDPHSLCGGNLHLPEGIYLWLIVKCQEKGVARGINFQFPLCGRCLHYLEWTNNRLVYVCVLKIGKTTQYKPNNWMLIHMQALIGNTFCSKD